MCIFEKIFVLWHTKYNKNSNTTHSQKRTTAKSIINHSKLHTKKKELKFFAISHLT